MTPHDRHVKETLNQQVKHQFNLGHNGLPQSDHYLLDDKDLVLSYDLLHTQRWLQLIEGAREEQIHLEASLHNKFKRARTCMKQWLLKANHPSKLKF
jgi:hypothetical protein